jgi:hypothetical protein
MHIASITAAAKVMVMEKDNAGPRFRRWMPFPGAGGEAGVTSGDARAPAEGSETDAILEDDDAGMVRSTLSCSLSGTILPLSCRSMTPDHYRRLRPFRNILSMTGQQGRTRAQGAGGGSVKLTSLAS